MPYKDPEKAIAYQALYREKNREAIRAKNMERYFKNREKYIAISKRYITERRLTDLNFRIADSLRARLRNALMVPKSFKSVSLFRDLIGCTRQEVMQHLENQFTDGMSWENYGRGGWTIDHIIPLSAFNLSNQEELSRAAHFTNLQPLWLRDNIIKSNKIKKDNGKCNC